MPFKKTQPGDAPTARQSEVLSAIAAYIVEHGFAPTVRELGERIGCSSPNGTTCHLKALEKKGLLIWDSHRARTMRLAPGSSDSPRKPTPSVKPSDIRKRNKSIA
jgi:SOS-response transcriptional repressor LexA